MRTRATGTSSAPSLQRGRVIRPGLPARTVAPKALLPRLAQGIARRYRLYRKNRPLSFTTHLGDVKLGWPGRREGLGAPRPVPQGSRPPGGVNPELGRA